MITNKTEIVGTPLTTSHTSTSITTDSGTGYVDLTPLLGGSYSSPPLTTSTMIEVIEKQFPKKIIKHGPALIIFWDDKGKNKTVVKKQKGKKNNLELAFLYAIIKHIYGKDFKKLLKAMDDIDIIE